MSSVDRAGPVFRVLASLLNPFAKIFDVFHMRRGGLARFPEISEKRAGNFAI